RAFNKVGVNYYQLADLRTSNQYLRRENEVYRRLVAREPQQMQWKERLAYSMAYLARGLDSTGEKDAAIALLREELNIENELAARDAANVEWQRATAVTAAKIGRALTDRGDPASAIPLLSGAYGTIKTVRKLAPTRTSFAFDEASVATDYGRALSLRGDRRGVALLEQALRITEENGAKPGANMHGGRACLYLGDALQRERPAAAVTAWERALRELPSLEQSKDPSQLAFRAQVLLRLKRESEARDVLARLRQSGYDVRELERSSSRGE
ncbi:MAG TPA: hypothetical protein VM733_18780, partial [Thermoanaerobaculia bacterium]|nr:hypothetical protein [Thermoanaerobaculia bacterium]